MTLLYIALIIIAVIGLIILLPITLTMSFALKSDENEISLRYMFLKLTILPAGEKKAEKKSKKDGQKGEEDETKKKSKKEYINTVRLSWSEIRWGISKLLSYVIKRAITVAELNISARFGFENAMNTGLACGAANGFAYNIIGLLDKQARLKKWSVDLQPDFDNQRLEAGVYCRLRTRIAHVFPLAVILLRTFIKIKIKIKNNGGKKNE